MCLSKFKDLTFSEKVKALNRNFNKKIFLGSLFPYILIVLIVFSVQFVSTTVVLNAMENNAIDIVENSFKANIAIIEENMTSVKETAIAVSQNVYEKLNGEKENGIFTRLVDARAVLKTYYVRNGFIKNICVQHDENDLLVNFTDVYSKRINFYSSKLHSNSLSSEELLENSETASGFSSDGICAFGEDGEVIPFFLPAPLLMERTGSVSIYIDKESLLLPMADLLNKNGGALRITNQSGNVLLDGGENSSLMFEKVFRYENGTKKSFGEKTYYVLHHVDNVSKWNYTMLVPEQYVMHDIKYYQLVSFGLNFLALVVGFALCLFFVLRKSESYVELLDMIGVDIEGCEIKNVISKNEYKYLSQHISKIKEENVKLLERDNQNVLRALLDGEFETEEDICCELKKHKLEFSSENHGVIVLYHKNKRISGSFAENFHAFILREIERIIPDAKVYFGEKNYTVILFSANDYDFTHAADRYISKLEIDIFFKYRIPVVVGVGGPVNYLRDVETMYHQAKDVIRYNLLIADKPVRYYSNLPEGDADYYYPVELRNDLFDSVLESNFENARASLRKIQEENFVNRELSLETITMLLTELRCDFIKIGKLKSEEIEFVQDNENISHFFEYATSFFYLLCSENENEYKSRSEIVCCEVQRYIDEHYTEANLSIATIAAEFRMHPYYLSSIFKKNTDCSIVSYIEKRRTEKAAELLLKRKYSVNEIAELVGYSNVSTFRRIFKKIKGVTPKEYTKSLNLNLIL